MSVGNEPDLRPFVLASVAYVEDMETTSWYMYTWEYAGLWSGCYRITHAPHKDHVG